ncbi:hypothetical protein WICPIJ_007357 [Wickerhamomyces pijperi]|uniref:Uncharacterized protein n=1 Tax=Wickerhamomyces pijperi TaxID=599730 RepID=A0A9P8Q036_WICPI|nr:hypothetical protein WICPIJ_007357 [Wickerhamomyces pijperi]
MATEEEDEDEEEEEEEPELLDLKSLPKSLVFRFLLFSSRTIVLDVVPATLDLLAAFMEPSPLTSAEVTGAMRSGPELALSLLLLLCLLLRLGTVLSFGSSRWERSRETLIPMLRLLLHDSKSFKLTNFKSICSDSKRTRRQ